MITKRTGNRGIRIRVPERVRLFIVNCIRSAPCKQARNFLFEVYAYQLLRPYFQFRLGQRHERLQYLFVLAPMRSGSSLLVHLLNSNPEVEGYGESHCAYTTFQDLEKLIYRTAVIQNAFDFGQARYVMDKVVRNHDISDAVLSNTRIKFIFLLREPVASYQSTASLGKACFGMRSYQSFDTWFNYYRERLDFLQNLAERINDRERCLFVRYADLLHKTDESLQKLQSFLGTHTAFSEQYTVSKNTGHLRYGDPSDVLKLGKISRQKEDSEQASPVFSKEEHLLAEHTYHCCVEQLSQYAQTIATSTSVTS